MDFNSFFTIIIGSERRYLPSPNGNVRVVVENAASITEVVEQSNTGAIPKVVLKPANLVIEPDEVGEQSNVQKLEHSIDDDTLVEVIGQSVATVPIQQSDDQPDADPKRELVEDKVLDSVPIVHIPEKNLNESMIPTAKKPVKAVISVEEPVIDDEGGVKKEDAVAKAEALASDGVEPENDNIIDISDDVNIEGINACGICDAVKRNRSGKTCVLLNNLSQRPFVFSSR